MDRRKEIVLAALSPAGREMHAPVQVQKLFFLIDREISDLINGPYFNFRSYSYGPFDGAVYEEMKDLSDEDYIRIFKGGNWENYELTLKGQVLGEEIFRLLPHEAQDYIKKAMEFVRNQSFTQLVCAICKACPDMRGKGVFQG